MEHNPYSPPTAPVADFHGDSVIDNRNVLMACKLFWVSFGLSLVGTASDVLRQSTLPLVIGGLIGAIIGAAVGFALTRWFVSKLKAGRNWMRLLVTILPVLGYLSVPIFWNFYSTMVFASYARNPVMAAISLLQIIPGAWAIVLLNLPRSRAWFSQQKKV
jgi:high-affinity Fe2+/Pb2+ permease